MDRSAEEPTPLDYLWSAEDQRSGAIDLAYETFLLAGTMPAAGPPAHWLSHANLGQLYWTPEQWVAHHTSNGCNLLLGDLLAPASSLARRTMRQAI